MSVFATDGPGDARVQIQMGHIQVVATDREDVEVTVTPSNPQRSGDRTAADAVRVTRAGNGIVVTGPRRLNLFGPGDSVDVLVEMPRASSAAVEVSYGDAMLSGDLGAVRAAVAYGELSIETVGRLEVKNGHGEIRVGTVTGDADISFKSGSARVGRVDRHLHLTGADGSIAVDTVSTAEIATSSGSLELGTVGASATIRSAYGAVRIREAVRGSIRVDGSYGSVDVAVLPGTAVWLDASSQHGVVRTALAADPGPALGEDTLELRIRTGYGAITVHRS